ncbi:MAG: 16S rRNA (cytidine(1402)-2'-O)-methyltransferase [Desulfobacterales bacterium]|nr:MAG: 16S rRNA (cytidine(1402)-2'-O)-methyltransferase [Desulfobacterales bacterium]
MPLNSLTTDRNDHKETGHLYVVATPIGHKDDITLRALNTLRKVDLVAAEDTRKTGRLLAAHAIKSPLISYHEHNEKKRTPELIRRLKGGESIALVSNAGTPVVSDPGYRLIEAAIANAIRVLPIPGVSAATAALSVAGLPTDAFVFVGFPPKKAGKRQKLLNELARESRTLIFYESPKRILPFLEEIKGVMGERRAVLAREMTKLHEEFLRGFLSEIIDNLRQRPEVKGECTLLLAGCEVKENADDDALQDAIREAVAREGSRISAVADDIAQRYGLARRHVYAEALRVRRQMTENGESQTADRSRMTEDEERRVED